MSGAGSCPPQGGMAGSRASFGTEAQVCAHSSEGTVSGYLACLPSSGPGLPSGNKRHADDRARSETPGRPLPGSTEGKEGHGA